MGNHTKKNNMECGSMKNDTMDVATNCGGGCCGGKKGKENKK